MAAPPNGGCGSKNLNKQIDTTTLYPLSPYRYEKSISLYCCTDGSLRGFAASRTYGGLQAGRGAAACVWIWPRLLRCDRRGSERLSKPRGRQNVYGRQPH